MYAEREMLDEGYMCSVGDEEEGWTNFKDFEAAKFHSWIRHVVTNKRPVVVKHGVAC